VSGDYSNLAGINVKLNDTKYDRRQMTDISSLISPFLPATSGIGAALQAGLAGQAAQRPLNIEDVKREIADRLVKFLDDPASEGRVRAIIRIAFADDISQFNNAKMIVTIGGAFLITDIMLMLTTPNEHTERDVQKMMTIVNVVKARTIIFDDILESKRFDKFRHTLGFHGKGGVNVESLMIAFEALAAVVEPFKLPLAALVATLVSLKRYGSLPAFSAMYRSLADTFHMMQSHRYGIAESVIRKMINGRQRANDIVAGGELLPQRTEGQNGRPILGPFRPRSTARHASRGRSPARHRSRSARRRSPSRSRSPRRRSARRARSQSRSRRSGRESTRPDSSPRQQLKSTAIVPASR
jgi:hypothetical protein